MTAYRRVLLKLSGEVFGGGKVGVDPDVVNAIAREIAGVVRTGVQVAVVVGGGNFFRGAELQQRGMDRSRADYMGMLGTVMNCLALQDFLEKQGVETRVQTAITMGQVAEPYIPRRAMRHLEKGRVVIFGAGAGMPYFSTDTVAAQRALEIGAEVILMGKQGVETRVQTAITMGQVAEPYIPRRAMRHLEKGRVVIFGAGAGMPYFSTDTVAAQRALEIGAQVILMGKQGVDGVYDSDPASNPHAVKFDSLSYDEFLTRGLKVADATSVSLCRDNDIDMIVFNLSEEGNIARVVAGEKIGTTVSRDV